MRLALAALALVLTACNADELDQAVVTGDTTTVLELPVYEPAVMPLAVAVGEPEPIQAPAQPTWGVESCGGSIDACLARIGACESTGSVNAPIDWTARSRLSTASGGYQFLAATWTAYGDPAWPSMADAPPDVQHAAAVRLFNARGSQPWFPSRHCWETP